MTEPTTSTPVHALLVPAHRRAGRDPGARDIGFELHRDPGGQVRVPAFTSADTLVAALGEGQPWVACRPEGVATLAGSLAAPLWIDPLPGELTPVWPEPSPEADR